MLLTSSYDPSTRRLTLTDATGTLDLDSVRVLYAVAAEVKNEVRRTYGTVFTLVLTTDGPYQFVAELQDPLTGAVLDTSNVVTHNDLGTQRNTAAELFLRHASDAHKRGYDAAARAEWVRLYALKATAGERNPATLRRLVLGERPTAVPGLALPALLPALPVAPGLPGMAAGVLSLVDVDGPNTATVYLDVAGASAVTATVEQFRQDADLLAAPAKTTVVDGRFQVTFPAAADGIYVVRLRFNGVLLHTEYVPVLRNRFRVFREYVRGLDLTGDRARRIAEADWLPYLTRLAAVEAACRCALPDLALALLASADRLPQPARPIATYPLRNG